MIGSPLVSVVLVSYNRPHYLARAIETALAQTSPDVEVIVVDNRSPASEEIAHIVAGYPGLRLIVNSDNIGFTGGMNAGITAARGRYVYLTEDDIEMEPGCLAALMEYLDAHPDAGMAGPVMLNRGSGTIRCAGGHFELGSVYRMTIVGAGESIAGKRFTGPYTVTYLPGAMMMARLDLLRDLCGFRDEFFMYVEDVELCARVLKRGLSIAVVPQARVFHHEPESGTAPGLEFHKVKNLSALYFIHAPLRVLPAFVLRYGLLGAVHAMTGDPRRIGSHLKAWAWTLVHTPRLLAERSRDHAATVRPVAPRS
jgi:hypothetical protein